MGTIIHLTATRRIPRSSPWPCSPTRIGSASRPGCGRRNKSPRTILTYLEAITRLATFLAVEGRAREVDRLGPEDIQAFIGTQHQAGAKSISGYLGFAIDVAMGRWHIHVTFGRPHGDRAAVPVHGVPA